MPFRHGQWGGWTSGARPWAVIPRGRRWARTPKAGEGWLVTPTVRLDGLRSISTLAGQVTGRWGCAPGCPTTCLHVRRSSVDCSPFRDKMQRWRQAGEPQNHTRLKSGLLMLCPYVPLGFHINIGPLGRQHYTNHFSGASRPERLN